MESKYGSPTRISALEDIRMLLGLNLPERPAFALIRGAAHYYHQLRAFYTKVPEESLVDAGNMPRQDAETGHGLVTDVCVKRKLRSATTWKQRVAASRAMQSTCVSGRF